MHKKLILVLMSAAMFSAGCQTLSATTTDMSDFKKDMAIKATAYDGQELGMVSGSEGGAIWANCNDTTKEAIREMIMNAKAKGANAIGNIKWDAKGGSEPSCKKGWGWFTLWPFVLTPLFMSTEVTGMAYKTNGAKSGMLMIPNTEAEEAAFINAVIAL